MRSYSLLNFLITMLLLAACALPPIDPEVMLKKQRGVSDHQTDTTQPNDAVIDPQSVADLEAIYGPPSQAGFGSAIFQVHLSSTDNLEQIALAQYKYFVGDLWEQYGADAWMGPWKEVYSRPPDAAHDIVAELRAIDDADAALSVPMILDNIDNAENARTALAAAYDDPAMTEVRVYNLGDGAAMSGLLVAGRRTTGEALFLLFLLD